MNAAPYPSIGDAAAAWLRAGGRIYVLPDGRCEEIIPHCEIAYDDETRETLGRYHATLAPKNAREAMAEHVRDHGQDLGYAVVLKSADGVRRPNAEGLTQA